MVAWLNGCDGDAAVLAGMAAEQLAARVRRQQRAAVKRVDDQIFRIRRAAPGRAAQQEVPGKIDPLHVEARPPRDLHVEQRERDRNAGAPVEHLVEAAVPRIFVVRAVADEVEIVEQEIVQRHHAGVALGIDPRRRVAGHDGRVGQAQPRFAAEHVELVEVGTGVELRVLEPRDHQRGDRQIGIGAERRDAKSCERIARDYHQY